MPSKITCLRIFIASPGGLADERKAFRDEIQDYNQAEAMPRGVLFQSVGWEDTLGAVGRPQAIINEDVRTSDYFILLLCDRWGSPPATTSSRFTSGTEEEHHVAMECYNSKESPMRQLVMMFKSVDTRQLSDPGPQLQKVLEFRQNIESQKTHLFHSFDTEESFRKSLRRHLAAWLRDGGEGGTGHKGRPPDTGPPIVEDSISIPKQQLTKPSERALVKNAWALADEGRLTEAEVEFARAIVGQSHPAPIIEFGRFLARIGRLDQAIVMFQGAAKLAEDQRDSSAVSIAYANLGMVLKTRGDLDGAEQMFRKSLAIEEKLGRLEGMASAYGNLGIVLKIRGDLDGAEQMYRKSLEIEEKLGRLEGMASDYGNLGVVLAIRGDLDGAEQMHRKALEINEKLGQLEGISDNYGNLGNVFFRRDDTDSAEKMYRKALAIEEKLGRLEGMASNYGSLGNVFFRRSDTDSAEKMYRKALAIEEKLGRLEGMANAYGNLGIVLKIRGDLDGAEQMYRKSLEIAERLGRLEGMVSDYGSLGVVLAIRGDLDGAEQMHRKALEIAERLGSSHLITEIQSILDTLH